jgi:hypothetical protein
MTHYLVAQTDWGKAMFVDEANSWLCNNHQWKLNADRDEVRHQKTKNGDNDHWNFQVTE